MIRRDLSSILRLGLALSAAVILAPGCSSSSSSSGDSTVLPPSNNTGGISTLGGAIVELDLASGEITAVAPGVVPAVSPTKVIFVRIDGGSASLSSVDWVTPTAIVSAVGAAQTIPTFYIADREITQAQWSTLVSASGVSNVSTQPWAEVTPASVFGVSANADLPATGLSHVLADTVCAAWTAGLATGRFAMAVPSGSQWEFAARGGALGSDELYHWGASETQAVLAANAVVAETAGGVLGPRVVGSLASNQVGLFDVHGNVWEWVVEATGVAGLRGGSWSDNVTSARLGNRLPVEDSVGFATAGFRPVLVLP